MMLDHPDFDIILSDINMPEMDGLTLLTKINEMRNPALKCIIVSAYGDMENIRTAMNHGAFDFATKPIDMEDLERTIEKAVEQISFIKEAQKEHHQLEEIQYDLNVAREIQQSILPKQFPPFPQYKQFDLYATMNAAKAVGVISMISSWWTIIIWVLRSLMCRIRGFPPLFSWRSAVR